MKLETFGELRVRLLGGTDGHGGGDGPLVVLLHGYGAGGDDLVPLAPELDVPDLVRFAFPEAPLELGQVFGAGARAWWHINVGRFEVARLTGKLDELMNDEPEGLADAHAKVEATLDALHDALGADPRRTILGGFSQGAMLSCDVALRSERPLAGLVLMSGTYLAAPIWTPRMEKREGLPVLQSHGRQDPLLPFVFAERLRDALVTAGLPVHWVPFDGAHGIAPMVLRALSDFIQTNTD